MRALTFGGAGRVLLAEVDHPVVEAPGEAVVRIHRSGLCGSDLHPWRGAEACAVGTTCGHEGVGTVVEVGAAVTACSPGDRVLIPFTTSCGTCPPCRSGLTARCVRGQLFGWAPPSAPTSGLAGCQAEAVRVPLADGTLVAVPAGVDDDTAVLLADNMPTAWYAVTRAEVPAGGRVAVVGLGAVGLCAVAAALARGAGEVLAVDPVAGRRAVAEGLGATAVDPDSLDPARAEVDGLAVDGLEVDAVVEAAGPPVAQRLAARLARPGGTVSIVSVQTAAAFGIDPVTAYDRNLTIRCGRAPVRAILDELLPLVAGGRVVVPTAALVTHPGRRLEEGPNLYALAAEAGGGLVKATFAPQG